MDLTAELVFNVALAIAAMLLVGVLAYFMLRLGDPAHYATKSGIASLAGLKWREFANLLIAMFRSRGFEPAEKDTRARASGGYDLMFTRGTARYLLLCKHGTRYRVTRADTDDFLMTMRTQGAEGGFIVALGNVDPDARQAVYARNLDLFDGKELWGEVQRFMPRELTDEALERAGATRAGLARRAVLLGALTGVLVFIGAMLLDPPPRADRPIAAAVSSSATEATADGATTPAAASLAEPAGAATPLPVAGSADVEAALALTQAQLSERRAAVIASARAVPGVVTADWSTNSTLLVTMEGLEEEARLRTVAAICAALADYEEMNWTRLQMIEFDAKEDGATPVRWHQCR